MLGKFEKLRRSGLHIFDLADLSILFGLTGESARVTATRMVSRGILTRLKRNLYVLSSENISNMEIANRLLVPSYVSFESSLCYWGITTQIPEKVTSASLRSKTFHIIDREFSFSHLPENLFVLGVVREANILIASPEKSLLDMIYYASLGKRSTTFDSLDFTKINKKSIFQTIKKYPPRARILMQELLQ